jgi:hypothetical protein
MVLNFLRRASAEPPPRLDTGDRDFLEDRSTPYRSLGGQLRDEFEAQVAGFVAHKRITGCSIEIDRADRLLVAASACTLSCGWRDFSWDRVTEVLLYPDDFDRDAHTPAGDEELGDGSEVSGEAHPWGTIILSLPALDLSFDDPDDGYHVGYHEFAHILDFSSSLGNEGAGGLPEGIGEGDARALSAALLDARRHLEKGQSPIDDYGLESDSELWACSVEAFFERPHALFKRHGQLYESLSRLFAQSPHAASAPSKSRARARGRT